MVDSAPSEPEALHCAAHPQVETYLRCGRCETPICPRCLIQTPVGSRCRDCAQIRKLPIARRASERDPDSQQQRTAIETDNGRSALAA